MPEVPIRVVRFGVIVVGEVEGICRYCSAARYRVSRGSDSGLECALTYDCGAFRDQHAVVPHIFLCAVRSPNGCTARCFVLDVGVFRQEEEVCERVTCCRLRDTLVAGSQDT